MVRYESPKIEMTGCLSNVKYLIYHMVSYFLLKMFKKLRLYPYFLFNF